MLRHKVMCAALAVPVLLVGDAEAAKIGNRLNTAAEAARSATLDIAGQAVVLTGNTVSSQIFGRRTPNNLKLGNEMPDNTGKSYIIELNRALRAGNEFGVELRVHGAQYAREMTGLQVSLHPVANATDDSATADVDESEFEIIGDGVVSTACNVSVRDSLIRLSGADCEVAAGATLKAITLSGFAFDNAADLATPGSTISLSGAITDPNDIDNDYEAIDEAVIVRSANTLSVNVTSGARVGIDSTADPAFSSIVTRETNALTAHLGTITATAPWTDDATLNPVW